MKEIKLNEVGTIRLNSFKPLCINDFGKAAVAKYNFSPFIDASCRREPDFENQFPSITALCRKGKFAPQLKEKDIVVYVTVQGKYPTAEIRESHNRLVAIVQVIKVCNNHQTAAEWYSQNDLPLPSNCMIEENAPKMFDQTAAAIFFKGKKDIQNFLDKPEEFQKKFGEKFVKNWDTDYKERAQTWQNFVITKPIFLELENPPIISREDFLEIFNRVPNTQTPNKINQTEFIKLAELAGLKIKIG